MSNFNYDKYKEIVDTINHLGSELKGQDECNYTSFKVEDIACRLISIGNSLNSYIRHTKKKS